MAWISLASRRQETSETLWLFPTAPVKSETRMVPSSHRLNFPFEKISQLKCCISDWKRTLRYWKRLPIEWSSLITLWWPSPETPPTPSVTTCKGCAQYSHFILREFHKYSRQIYKPLAHLSPHIYIPKSEEIITVSRNWKLHVYTL